MGQCMSRWPVRGSHSLERCHGPWHHVLALILCMSKNEHLRFPLSIIKSTLNAVSENTSPTSPFLLAPIHRLHQSPQQPPFLYFRRNNSNPPSDHCSIKPRGAKNVFDRGTKFPFYIRRPISKETTLVRTTRTSISFHLGTLLFTFTLLSSHVPSLYQGLTV